MEKKPIRVQNYFIVPAQQDGHWENHLQGKKTDILQKGRFFK
jgi:hypothetical protein